MCAIALAACTTTGVRQAPIVDRTQARAVAVPEKEAPPVPVVREAKEGMYAVQKGDTLFSIASAFGRDHRDIARWNSVDDPSKLRVGQVLRVTPPVGEASAAALPVTPARSAQARPLGPAASVGGAVPPVASVAPQPSPPATPGAPSVTLPTPPAPAPAAEPAMNWAWPLNGKVIDRFDEKRNKGIDIAVREGDPVLAASDGNVVYSGSGLRGYGNLVIIKHDDEFISAYAHNRQILVKQGQTVKRGQRIAEAGKSDAVTPKLHFEIRQHGKPVDPLQYLPPR